MHYPISQFSIFPKVHFILLSVAAGLGRQHMLQRK
jgi:hypothetical protein